MTTTGTSPSPSLGSGAIDNRYAPSFTGIPPGQLSPPPAMPPSLPPIPNQLPQQIANQPTSIPQSQGINQLQQMIAAHRQSLIDMLPPQFGQQLANLPQGINFNQLQQMIAAHRQAYRSPLDHMIGQRQYTGGTQPTNGLANTLGIRRS